MKLILHFALTLVTAAMALAQRFPDETFVDVLHPEGGDQVGSAVFTHGEFVLAAGRGDRDPAGPEISGIVHVFRRTAAGPEYVQQLKVDRPGDLSPWNKGRSFCAAGDFLFVSSPLAPTPDYGGGVVEVYRRGPDGYTLAQTLHNPPGYFGGPASFGFSMLEHDGDVWISMPSKRVNGHNVGALTRYGFDGNAWFHEVTIDPPDTSFTSAFRAFGIEENRIVTTDGVYGAAVFEKIGTNWVVTQRFTKSGNDVNQAVSVGDGWAFFGDADLDVGFFRGPGHVQAFRWNGDDYEYVQEIDPLNQVVLPDTGDRFGYDVDFKDGRLLVGAPMTTRNGTYGEGAAYIFEHDGTEWAQTARLEPPVVPNPHPLFYGLLFGETVHQADDVDLIGMPGYTGQNFRTGGAHVFRRPLGALVCGGNANSTGAPGTLSVEGSLAASAEFLFAESDSLPASTPVLLSVGRAEGFTPMLGGGAGDLCIQASGVTRLGLTIADSSGAADWTIDTGSIPGPNGPGVTPGDTLVFQAWYRDTLAGGAPTSNLTAARRIELR